MRIQNLDPSLYHVSQRDDVKAIDRLLNLQDDTAHSYFVEMDEVTNAYTQIWVYEGIIPYGDLECYQVK